MKVILVPWRFSKGYHGGLEMIVGTLVRKLKQKGHAVTVIATLVDPGDRPYEVMGGVDVYRLPFPIDIHYFKKGDYFCYRRWLKEIVEFPYVLFKMWRIMKKKKPDVVNMHYAGPPSYATLILSYLLKFKFVLTLHGFSPQHLRFPDAFKIPKLLFKLLLRRADFVTAPSLSLLEDAAQYYEHAKEKSRVISNGIDLGEFDSRRKDLLVNQSFYQDIDDIDGFSNLPNKFIYSNYKYWPTKEYGSLFFAYKSILERSYDLSLVIFVMGGDREKYLNLGKLLNIDIKKYLRIIDGPQAGISQYLLKKCEIYVSLSKGGFPDPFALETASLGGRVVADESLDGNSKRTQQNILYVNTENESRLSQTISRALQINKGQQKIREKDSFFYSDEWSIKSPYILTVCNLHRYKGVDILIKAFQKVSFEFPEVYLFIAGDGPEIERLDKLKNRLRLNTRIVLLGTVGRWEVVKLFEGCLFFVLASLAEPFGIVNLEAMAAAKAIVASCVGAIPEIVKHNVNGILVEPKDSEALARGMMRLLGDEELTQRLGKKGREIVENRRFYWDRIVDEYVQVYAEAGNRLHVARNR